MEKSARVMFWPFATALIIGVSVFFTLVYPGKGTVTGMSVSEDVYSNAENALKDYLGMTDSVSISGRVDGDISALVCGDSDLTNVRMTQRVTVYNADGFIPVSGTVSKSQDVYYPGTYELRFGNKVALSKDAIVGVKIDVKKGEKVYILTGDKEVGYTQYAVLTASQDNYIRFATRSIRDYTISTTDICSAQEAMENLTLARSTR